MCFFFFVISFTPELQDWWSYKWLRNSVIKFETRCFLIVLFRVPIQYTCFISPKAKYSCLKFDFQSFMTTLGKFKDKESCFKRVTQLYICSNECGRLDFADVRLHSGDVKFSGHDHKTRGFREGEFSGRSAYRSAFTANWIRMLLNRI